MVNQKISAMPSAASIGPTDVIPIVQGGANKTATAELLGVVKLTEAATFYVSTTGDDSTGDGSSGAPWATIQHAANVICGIDLAGYNATIQLADSVTPYAGAYIGPFYTSLTPPYGAPGGVGEYYSRLPTVSLLGNASDATKVTIGELTDDLGCILFCVGSLGSPAFTFTNVTLDASNLGEDYAPVQAAGCFVFVGNDSGGTINVIGPATPGNGGDLFTALMNGVLTITGDTLNISGVFDDIFAAVQNGQILAYPVINFGENAAVNGAFFTTEVGGGYGGTVILSALTVTGTLTGPKFASVGGNSVIDITALSGSDLTTLPGTVAGTVTSGGIYLSATATLRDMSNLPTSAGPSGSLYTTAGAVMVAP